MSAEITRNSIQRMMYRSKPIKCNMPDAQTMVEHKDSWHKEADWFYSLNIY